MKIIHGLLVVILLCSSVQAIVQSSDIFHNDRGEMNAERGLFRVTPAVSFSDIPRSSEIVGGNPGIYHDMILDPCAKKLLIGNGYQLEARSWSATRPVVHCE